MAQDTLIIHGAREHNLKNITVEIPRDQFVVITGLSGSGKSSLAFDTIYAEGQRRYVESLSAYARQFLGQMEKPDVDQIEGLSPAICIDQKGVSHNPRSTVGTVTEIYDYLRLLYARIGVPHCPECGRGISQQSAAQIVEAVLNLPEGTRTMILAPLVKDRKGHHQAVFEDVRRAGYVRVRVDYAVRDVDEEIVLDRYKMHTIEAVVDRLVVRCGDDDFRTRLTDSVETALRLGDGILIVCNVSANPPEDLFFSEHFACPLCGRSFAELEPRSFSFNTPHGACPDCQGLGTTMEIDPHLVVPNPYLSLKEGAVAPWSRPGQGDGYYAQLLQAVSDHFDIPLGTPFGELPLQQQATVLYGHDQERIPITYRNRRGRVRRYMTYYEGVIPHQQRLYEETSSDYTRSKIEGYMTHHPCASCSGSRLKPESLAVTIDGTNIAQVSQMSVTKAVEWVDHLCGEAAHAPAGETQDVGRVPSGSPLAERQWTIGRQILKEIKNRLNFMVSVGLDYLTLGRTSGSLSGGEAERIRLATQVGSQLVGVLYILDEPTIGLHQRDNARLIHTLKQMRDLGNTLLIVEHDEGTIRAADFVVDLGPGAGERGGYVVAAGPLETILSTPESITGQYLSGRRRVLIPAHRRNGNGSEIVIQGAREHNLKDIEVHIPLGKFVCITGVSGSGKSTLLVDILYKRLAQVLHNARQLPGDHDDILGVHHLDKVINIDQSPIGRTPRSNPATYTNLFTPIRVLFASLPDAKVRGYDQGRFSFNVKGGRCEACGGQGTIQIEMQFMADIYINCDVCKGKRYNRETLQVRFKDKSIADVLDMTVDEAMEFFENIPRIQRKLETLKDVGLGYVRLGQPSPTLSGGEAQRIKLSRELSKVPTGQTFYILDEPSVGLHAADVDKLLTVLDRLVDRGNTVVIIEHHPDIIKVADWVIDLGPEGGDAGGYVVAQGTPEEVAQVAESYTGVFLRDVLAVQPTES
jgi:excinuclease ABC subunit A